MHSHTIILAALSAGALSVSLTAKDFTNSANQPNVKCTGANNGMDVGIDYVTCPAKQPDCNCHLYEPPNGSYVWIDYFDVYAFALYGIDVFSDTNCQNLLTTVLPSTTIMKDWGCEGCSDSFSDCVFMGEDVQWGSVRVGDPYSWPGVSGSDG
ncbi:MAG: hypothetical protein ALECFALPRED_001891 [Alectoria fallacina]|uniref:Uncharacterized protein n=1 Tax=Alectoria fallacina TaxID=1903189 RepID=A0A8H3IBD0_9LECA|nr:MAG: hypothetical protein ALECFALPRED_001891 [Alectoria fallacina]